MNTYPADFIAPDVLEDLAAKMFRAATDAAQKSKDKIYRNVIDPFSATVDSICQGITVDEWLKLESMRQSQKGLQNAIGYFHQDVLGSVKGWENMGRNGAIDVRSSDGAVVAEIKNKFNTMNSGSALAVYDKLAGFLDYNEKYKGRSTAYVVFIVPRSPVSLDDVFCPSDKGTRRQLRQDIRMIDGASFYHKATGDPDALEKLYHSIPLIAENLIGAKGLSTNDELYQQLFNRVYKR